MRICKTEKEFIEAVALSAQRACARYGYLPSVLIAQAALETGYAIRDYWDNPGVEQLLKHNNMIGQKKDLLTSSWYDKSVWPGKSFAKETPEVYRGKKVTKTDEFRIFDNIEQSFCDYLLFLLYASNEGNNGTPKYGKSVVSIQDPASLIEAVRARGYATDPSYDNSVMKIVKKHSLTKYDDLTGVQPTEIVPEALKPDNTVQKTEKEITIIRRYLTTNNSSSTNDPQYIVIHNTDNFDRGADALAHAKALYQGDIEGMSWHYAVDDSGYAYQCIPHNRGAWHVGKNYGSHNLFGVVHNRNSIGIEMCVQAGYNYEKAFQNTVRLTRTLMKELGIPQERVVTHQQVCSKDCPSQILKNGDWERFKKLIGESPKPRKYLTIGDSGDEVRQMQQMLTACGYPCGSIDGEFGERTAEGLMRFKKDHGLKHNARYYPVTRKKLKTVYKKADFASYFLTSCQSVVDKARTEHWKYGDSHTLPPCEDKTISCDRLVARALYDLGFTDQRMGGETCGSLDGYLTTHGFTKVGKKNQLKPGAVVAVRNKDQSFINHVFVIKSYDHATGTCVKYDTGSNERIRTKQPTTAKLVEWPDRVFVAGYNVPTAILSADHSSTDLSSVD